MRLHAVVLLLVVTAAGVVAADLTPEQTQEAQALIKQFSARQFAARQQAVQKLIEMGPDVVPLVRKTLAETRDAEVKLRCRMVIEGIVKKYNVVIEDNKVIAPDFDASRVTIDATDVPLKEVLNLLAQESGNRPVGIDIRTSRRRMTFKVKNMPYWQAIDTLCRSAKLRYNAGSRGLPSHFYTVKTLVTGLGVYSGPVSVKMRSITRRHNRQQTRRFDARRTSDKTSVLGRRDISFNLVYHIEDRLPSLETLGRITRVVTPDGVNHVPPLTGREPFKMRWTSNSSMSFSVDIKETGDELKGPVTLEGYVAFGVGVGKEELRLKNIFGGGNPTARDDKGLSLKLLRAAREKDGETTIVFEVGYDARDTQVRKYVLFGRRYGLGLIDPNRKRHWRPNRVSRPGSTGKMRVTLGFNGLPDIDGEWSIVLTRPKKIVKKTYPFKIENVPLP